MSLKTNFMANYLLLRQENFLKCSGISGKSQGILKFKNTGHPAVSWLIKSWGVLIKSMCALLMGEGCIKSRHEWHCDHPVREDALLWQPFWISVVIQPSYYVRNSAADAKYFLGDQPQAAPFYVIRIIDDLFS